jgi:hypothetical protein
MPGIPRVPPGYRGYPGVPEGGGSWNVTVSGLKPHGMNCYGTLPMGLANMVADFGW